jgi:hypothetical protein
LREDPLLIGSNVPPAKDAELAKGKGPRIARMTRIVLRQGDSKRTIPQCLKESEGRQHRNTANQGLGEMARIPGDQGHTGSPGAFDKWRVIGIRQIRCPMLDPRFDPACTRFNGTQHQFHFNPRQTELGTKHYLHILGGNSIVHNRLHASSPKPLDQSSGRAGRREEPCDNHVGVENCPDHVAAVRRTRRAAAISRSISADDNWLLPLRAAAARTRVRAWRLRASRIPRITVSGSSAGST